MALKSVADDDVAGVDELHVEYRVGSRLAHPQIPRYIDLWHDQSTGRVNLVSELIEGKALSEVLPDRLEWVPQIVAMALNVVGFLHRDGLVHGDIKPAHLLVTGPTGGSPKLHLLDLGFSHEGVAQGGRFGGTPKYAAPTARSSGRTTPSTDLFALGRSFLEVLQPSWSALSERLARVITKLAEPDDHLRYASATAALNDLRPLLPRDFDLPRPWEAGLVGRTKELSEFEDVITDMCAGRLAHSLVLVSGEAGMGKSRLLREMAVRARLRGIHALIPSVNGRSLLGWVADISVAREPAGNEVRREGGVDSTRIHAGTSTRRLLHMARALQRSSKRVPILLVVDDWERLDEPSQGFVRLLARMREPSGPLILVSHQPTCTLVADARREGTHVRHLRLGPLDDAECARVVSALASELGGSSYEDLGVLAEGSPFMATLMGLETPAKPPEGSTPKTLESLLCVYWDSLGSPSRALLRHLAFLQQPVSTRFLAAVCGQTLEWIRAAAEALGDFVTGDVARQASGLLLRSQILRRWLTSRSSRDEARHIHGAIFERGSSAPFEPEFSSAELVHHALEFGDIPSAVKRGVALVSELTEQGAMRDAEALIRRLLPHSDGDTQRHLLGELADLLLASGRGREAKPILNRMHDTRATTETHDPTSAEWFLRSGTLKEVLGDLDGAVEELTVASEELAAKPGCRRALRALERLGAARFRQGEIELAQDAWERGIRLAGDRLLPEVADLWNDLGAGSFHQLDFTTADIQHQRALAIRRDLGDLDGEARSLTNLANLSVRRGDLIGGRGLHLKSLRIKRHVGAVVSQAVSLHNLGVIALRQGDYLRALDLMRECLRLRIRSGDVIGCARAHRELSHLFMEKGQWRSAAEHLRRARSRVPGESLRADLLAPQILMESQLSWGVGNIEEAMALVEEAVRILSAQKAASRHQALQARGTMRMVLGEGESGQRDLNAALEHSRRCEDPWALSVALLDLGTGYLWVGEPSAAKGPLEECRERATALGARRLIAQSTLGLAWHAQASGSLEDAAALIARCDALSAKLALPKLRFEVNARRGMQAYLGGQLRRAIGWWTQCAESLVHGTTRLGASHSVDVFLQHPERRWVLLALERALDEAGGRSLGLESQAMHESSMGERARVARLLERSVGQSDGRGIEPGSVVSKRPELVHRVLQISQRLNGLHGREEFLDYVRARLHELFDGENGRVVLVGRDDSLRVLGQSDTSLPPISTTLVRRVISEGVPVLISDTAKDPELREGQSVRRLGIVSILCAPLIVDEQVLGVLHFDQREGAGAFSAEDLTILELFANQVATALRNVLLLEEKEQALELMAEAQARFGASERLRAFGEMATGVVHNVNNSLASVLGLCELLLHAEDLPEHLRSDVQALHRGASNGAETLRRLKAFAGQPEGPAASAHSAEDLVKETLALHRHRLAPITQVSCAVSVEPCGLIWGVGFELRDLLFNLVANALDAMGQHGTLRVCASSSDIGARITVADSGPGMDRETQRRIFEPFFTTKPNGQGLGLSLCWGVVRRMGGDIRVESALGVGTTFTLELPAVLGREPSPVEVPKAGETRRAQKTILVVDDDPDVRQILCRTLQQRGYASRDASSGEAALAYLESRPVDLVLTDCRLGELDGVQLAAEVRARFPLIPVLLMTGGELPTLPVSLSAITKPISGDDLEAAVLSALESHLKAPDSEG